MSVEIEILRDVTDADVIAINRLISHSNWDFSCGIRMSTA